MVSRRSEEHTSELQSRRDLVCRLLLEKKKKRLQEFRAGPQDRQPLLPDQSRALPGYRRGADLYPQRALRCGLGHRRIACFFFNDTATTEIYTLSLHDALPI